MNTELRYQNLTRKNFQGSDLSNYDLTGARFPDANLSGCNMTYSDASKVCFEGANLSGADLKWAQFYKADLRGCDLRGCDLRNVNFMGANLSGAILDENPDFSGCALNSVKGIAKFVKEYQSNYYGVWYRKDAP